MSFTLLGILNSQAAGAGGVAAYDLLETTVLTSSASSVSFTGLDAYTDYKHLQIRLIAKGTTVSTGDQGFRLSFNSDTANNYNSHFLEGDGTSVISKVIGLRQYMELQNGLPLASLDAWGASVIDVLDFASTDKNTTIRALQGYADPNADGADGRISLQSGLYFVTDAITSATFNSGSDYAGGSRFSLYGIKG